MIPILQLDRPEDRKRVENLLSRLRLDPVEVALSKGHRAAQAAAVHDIMQDVAQRGDQAVVDVARKFDDPNFNIEQLRVSAAEMKAAHARVPANQLSAIRRSIAQVREYQSHFMPHNPAPLKRDGVELGLRFTPLDSVGIYFPSGKASYPSSLIMLAVPAQVAGVKKIVVCTSPSKYGRNDLILAACHELGITDFYRAGGAAAIAAMAFGTKMIPAVDKIVGPGNDYVQLAKRAVAGCVGIDGYLGPSEILTLADETGRADFIAADMIAQAEHDPGSCFLLTTSASLADDVAQEIQRQLAERARSQAVEKSLRELSMVVVSSSMDGLISLANRFACEHVNVQTRDDQAVLAKLMHCGAVFTGPWSPVAAGDYVAGPSHCLPTNTTARFTSGISVYEFLKRSSVVHYQEKGLKNDAAAIIAMAEAEDLDGHAASIEKRVGQ